MREKLLQIRLSEEELARIKELAGDLPVSQYARGVLLQKYVTATGSMEKVVVSDAPLVREAIDEKTFKRKVAQIMGKTNCSLPEAEEEARKRLGME